jgi:stage III sporulation protein AD
MEEYKMWKLIAAAVVAAAAAIIVRQVRPDLAVFVQVGGICAVCMLLLTAAGELLGALEGMLNFASVGGGSFTLLAKALGICVTTQMAADVCRDTGSGALANSVELGGRILVLVLALPLLKSLAVWAVGLFNS